LKKNESGKGTTEVWFVFGRGQKPEKGEGRVGRPSKKGASGTVCPEDFAPRGKRQGF